MAVYTEAIQKLYVAYFNRPADYEGLLWWEKIVTAAKGDTGAVSAAFAGSKEYKDTYAGMTNLQVVLAVYKNLFNESNPDMAGVDFWVNALNAKTITIDNVVAQIAAGAQSTHKDTYAAKVAAATAFTAALDTPAEAAGYIGDAANAAAKAWLSGINKATLEAAIAPAALNATVGTVTNPPVVGKTVNLTKGMDILVGTSANDTFNAFAFDVANASAAQETFQGVDTIDGGAGNDVLNISIGAGNENAGLLGSSTNVESIVINASAAAAGVAVDAARFAGATGISQIGKAGAVTNLAVGTTAGFNGVAAGALSVTGTAAATSVAVSMANVGEAATLTVAGAALTGATVAGTRSDTNADGTTDKLNLTFTAGKDVQAITLNAGVATTLTVGNAAGSAKFVNSVDLSASTAGVTYNAAAAVTTIKGGAGADALTTNVATVAADTGVTAVTATVEGGAGGDTINVTTTGNGLTTIDAGAGDDKVIVNSRGSGKLTVNMGDGADSFSTTGGAVVGAADAIDAGAGTDTLLLSLVGSANIGAFSNFEGFDAVGLNKTLDVDILATKNTVTEFVASGNVGVAKLDNVGAGVGVRATGSMTGSVLEVNQKTAGALTVTVDADEAGKGNDAAELPVASIKTNATSVKAVFDTAYVADTAAEKLLAFNADNYTALTLDVASATAVEVVSGGANATNALTLTNAAKVAAVTVSGAQALHFVSAAGAAKLTSIDASAATGGLRASTDLMADGGAIKLGSGVDIITVGAGSVAAGIESLVGFEKTAAAAVGTDATAAAAAQADADVLSFGAAGTVATDVTIATGKVAKGVLTFTGAGPADLAAAIAIADAAAETLGEVVVFEYLGNSYVFQQGAADLIVKLTGVTGVTNLGEVGATDTFFLV